MRSLSFCFLIFTTAFHLPGQVNGVYREVYSNIGGGVTINDLTSAPIYPNSPSTTEYLTSLFEAPTDVADNYGQRCRALLLAPVTGNYIFWVASDDASDLYLSTTENPANKTRIAFVAAWTSSREWSKEANQQSVPIALEGGSRYYIEALMKEGSGGDNLAVRWQLPGGTIEEPIPASRLIAFTGVATQPPTISQQPANTSVVEGSPASFTVRASNGDPVTYQWQRGGVNISGATSPTYTLNPSATSDSGAQFRCVLNDAVGTTTSSSASLTVTPDSTKPTIALAQNVGTTQVKVVFSEAVEVASGANKNNYALSGGVTINSAAFGTDTKSILLTTTPITFGLTYVLTVNNVRDRASTPNTILPNSQFSLFASDYTPQDVGSPGVSGSTAAVSGGYDVTGGGNGIGGTSDSFHFTYQQRTGDFDLKVCVEGMVNTDPWAQAGLMARETLDPLSRFAGAFAAPSIAGTSFLSRDPAGASALVSGQFPVNYPYTWLRLRRVGNAFTGYASFDGATWTQLGTATIAMPTTVLLGLAASGHKATQATVVQFRDLQNNVGGTIGTVPTAFEPLGPSSRRTGLVLSEIMYHPPARADSKELEFVELFNSTPVFEDLSGYRLSGEIDYTFPNGTAIPGGGFLVIARVPADVQSVYGLSGVLGPYTNNLPNDNGTLRLRSAMDAVLLEVNYDTKSPWPIAADGAGHSLVLARPSYGEGDPKAWEQSEQIGGSPGGPDPIAWDPLRNVVINEFLAHTDPPDEDFIELYNHGNTAVTLTGCYLSDDPDTNKFQIPVSTIPARGFVAFTATQLGFNLSASGESIFLVHSNGTRVLDAVRFESQENSVSMGRFPNGAPDFARLATSTPGGSNTAPRVSEVVLNEIMYSPITGEADDEFVELYNRTPVSVNLAGWRLSGGISFNFPNGTSLASSNYLVVARNSARLLANYPGLNPAVVRGDYSGSLAGGGERLTLTKPDELLSTNNSVIVTNIIHIVVDEVSYKKGGRWGPWADGGGSSLELLDPRSDHRRAMNWGDSYETNKAVWSTIEWTGVMDNGNGACDSLQILMEGAGECLVDNVEVIPQGGANIANNPNFSANATGWFFQGTHDPTTWQSTGGFGDNGGCLHVRAAARGDTGANRIRSPLLQALNNGTTVTLRAKVRWLVGYPEILIRLKGNYLEAAGRMTLPTNLGTPGARNSRYAVNAGPAIWDVSQSPVLPAASQAVIITARVYDPDNTATFQLRYRVDPNATLTTVNLLDNGTGGDAIAGDGIFSGTIVGQNAGTLVAFQLQATDGFSPAATTRFPEDAPTRECLIRWGETQPRSTFGAYRILITQATANSWAARERNSNKPLDCTFTYNSFRVIYNAQTLYSGSPWHTPGYNGPLGNLCDYVLNAPEDDVLLGSTDFVLATVGNLGNDGTAQAEQAAFWIAQKMRIPSNYRRYFHMFINGQARGAIYEDSQQPNSDFVDEYFADDDDGNLHKIEDWFEFDDSGDGRLFNVDATLQNFTTTGGAKKAARYRWCWRPRAVKESANNFTNLFNMVDALNAAGPEPYTSQSLGQVDMEEWMRIFAVEHIAGNWDAYGYNRGKNMYGYKPVDGKWTLFMWDIDFVLGSGSDGPTTGLFGSNDPTVTRMWSHPPFLRAYWRALEDAVNGPLVAANMDPTLDAKYAAFLANGVAVSSPSGIKSYVASRRSYISSQLATVAAPFAISSNGGTGFSTNNNLLQLTGTAPVGVKTIVINGIAYEPTWTGVTTWLIRVPLGAGANTLNLIGYDLRGNPVAGATDSITVTYTGVNVSPVDNVVINEIMYNPLAPGASYVELYNLHSSVSFNLSNWRLNGADFTFPEGTVITPGGFLLVVTDRDGFINAYGNLIPIVGEMAGNLDNGGENLQLIRPGPPELIVDEVRFDDDAPWPSAADGTGPSLQLIDPAQDNRIVSNWTAAQAGGGNNPPVSLITIGKLWRYEQASDLSGLNWMAPSYNDGAWATGLDLLYVESAALPAAKNTALTLGRTTYYFRTHFNFSGSPSEVSLALRFVLDDGAVVYLNGSEIYRIGMPPDPVDYNTFANRTVGDAVFEGPFIIPSTGLIQGDNVLAVEVHQANATSSDIVFGMTLDTTSGTVSGPFTPGAVNSVRASVPAFPKLWLNEMQTVNLTGPQDGFGDREPWLELHNAGAGNVVLTNFYLTDSYANLLKWPFPSGAVLNAGQYKTIWADGESSESSVGEWHTSFRFNANTGSVALVEVIAGAPRIVDFINYSLIPSDKSFGSFPDDQPNRRRLFSITTPGGANNSGFPPVQVFINEIMAGNAATLVDPADGKFDDWVELYNAGSTAVDLTGYFLTDNLADKTKFVIPAGKTIPAGGFLLVWADSDTSQNAYGADIHTSFNLALGGEAFGLYNPNTNVIDEISFLQQTNDISLGRCPDGFAPPLVYFSTPTPRGANICPGSGNTTPTLDPLSNRTVDEGTLLSFTAVGHDADNPPQTLTYSLVSPPAGAAIGTSSGVFTWVPAENQGPNFYTLTVRVTDNGSPSLNTTRSFQVTVREANIAPVLGSLPDRTATEGIPLSFTATATDSDLPAQNLTFTLEPGAPSGASITAGGAFTWTPSETQGANVFPITIRVTDDTDPVLSDFRTFQVNVNETNSAPTLTALPTQNVSELATLNVTNVVSDPDVPPNALTFALLSAPTGVSLNPSTGVLTWTPTETQGPNTNVITLRVFDNGTPSLSATQSVTVVVNEVNSAPVLTAPPNQTIAELVPFTGASSATDADQPTNTLTFALVSGPSGVSVNPASGAITWTPTEAQGPGVYAISIKVSDNGSPSLSSTQQVSLTVSEVNTAPILTVPSTQTTSVGVNLNATNTASDLDLPANSLLFGLVSGPSGATLDPATGVFSWTPSVSQGASTNTVTVRLFDNGSPSLSVTQNFLVIVSQTNHAPTLAPIAEQTVNELATLSVTNSASDPDGASDTLTFALVSAPTGVSLNPSSGVLAWTPSEAQGPNTNVITLRVFDDGTPSLSTTQSFRVFVNEVNTAPVLNPVTDKTMAELATLSVTNQASDNDLPAQTLTYALVSAPTGATINPSSGVLTWTPSEAQGPGSAVFTVRAFDNGAPSLSSTQSFSVNVTEVNVAPVLAPIGNRTVTLGQTISFTVIATDADLPVQPLVYTLDPGAPTGASIDSDSGLFTWTPTLTQSPSTNSVTIRVSDGVVSVVQSITITASSTVELVSLTNVWRYDQSGAFLGTIWKERAFNDSAWPAGAALLYNETTPLPAPTNTPLALTNPAGTRITNYYFRTHFNLPGDPAGVTLLVSNLLDDGAVFYLNGMEAARTNMPMGAINATTFASVSVGDATNFLVFNLPASNLLAGDNVLAVEVHQSSATSSDVVFGLSLTASFPPISPLAITSQPADLAVTVGTPAQLTIGVTGTTPRYQWWKDNAPLANETNALLSIPSAQLTHAGQYHVVVTNLLNSLTSRTAILTVNPAPNTPPVLTPPPNTTINELATLQLTNRATDADVPAQTLRFALVSGPPGLSLDAISGVILWTPTEAQGPSINPISVRVFDDGLPSLSVTQSFNITVNEVNTTPALAPIPDYTVRRNRLLTFTNAATDLDLPPQTLTFTLEGTPPVGAVVSANTGVFSWTPDSAQAPSTNTLSIRVTDAGAPALSAVRAFVVTVTTPVSPAIHLTDNGDGSVTLSWDTVLGEIYLMEFSEDLGPGTWQAVGGPVTGTSQSTSITDSPSGLQRFYRLRLAD